MTSVVAIVQARMGSTGLEGKVLKHLAGKPMLFHVVDRLRAASTLDSIVIATTQRERDRPIIDLAEEQGLAWYAGPEDDVLARYEGAAREAGAGVVVRITSDCPLIDPVTVDGVVRYFSRGDYDYVSAGINSGFPRGLDTEVFTREALSMAHRKAEQKAFREHVTLYICRHPEEFKVGRYSAPPELSHPEWRLCVDEEADFRLMVEIYDRLYEKSTIIDMREVAGLLLREPRLLRLNAHVRQKEV
ncbi:MAG: glycosyltransferase family protein [Deltaproteobacteria bacterium]|nr:glycosyltransferase family protein [Deltaproteobacteria bacterium]